MLVAYDYFFFIFHTILILFNLFGWAFKRTRRLNLFALLLTLFSWTILGFFYGWGYCPLTEWHWNILHDLGETNLPHSYITYLFQRIFNWSPSTTVVHYATWIALLASITISIFLNFFHKKKKTHSLIILGLFFIFHPTISSCKNNNTATKGFQMERTEMVINQIKARGIKDPRVLNAMKTIQREDFIPNDMKEFSYSDGPLPIGFKQTISQPYIVAYMSEALELNDNDRVLEIGTGSGYQAAVLSLLAKEVYSIEIVKELGERSKATLKEKKYDNVKVKIGDGYQGWKEYAPFTKIILTAAPGKIPQPLIEQLAIGGKLIAPVGVGTQKLILLTKTKDGIDRKVLLLVRFVPMTGKALEDD